MEYLCKSVESEISEVISVLFPEERICCLLRYGPKETLERKPPADFDFLLMLDEFHGQDYIHIQKIKNLNLPIEIFIDYKSHILLRGLENYKRGCHGVYFVYILASAETLLGENFFTDKVNSISLDKVRTDLIDRIEEYFYRIQKTLLNSESVTVGHITVKYISRILTDLLLLNDEFDFADMHTYHYTDIVRSKLSTSNLFSIDEVVQIQKLFETPLPSSINQIVSIIAILNSVFEQLMKNRNE